MIRDDIRNEIQHCIIYNREFKYLDKNTFVLEFGDGKFVDEDNEPCFYHIEYHLDMNEWVFQKWYEDEICDAELTSDEEQYIIAVVKELMPRDKKGEQPRMANNNSTSDKNKVLIDKARLIEIFVDAERLSMNPAEKEKSTSDYFNNFVSNDEFIKFIKQTAISNTAQTVISCISHLCDIKPIINDVKKNPDWDVDLFVSLRFGNEIINPDEIFVIRCDLPLSDKSILETSFKQSNAKLREDNHTVVEIKAEHFDTTLYPFSLVLPYKLLSGKVKEISHLTVFLPEHIYSNSDVEVNIDELAFIVTNKSTGDAITIAVETENADIEVRNKP